MLLCSIVVVVLNIRFTCYIDPWTFLRCVFRPCLPVQRMDTVCACSVMSSDAQLVTES